MGIQFSQLPIATSIAANDQLAVLDVSENILKRMNVTHASDGNAYGLSTASLYGHTKIQDNLNATAFADGVALAAHQGNVIAKDFGPLETGASATAAHAKGDYFVWKGQLVKATAAISAGTVLTTSNTSAVSVSSVFKQFDTKLPAPPTTAGQYVEQCTISGSTAQYTWVPAGPQISLVT